MSASPSVPVPTFVSFCSTRSYECRSKETLPTADSSVALDSTFQATLTGTFKSLATCKQGPSHGAYRRSHASRRHWDGRHSEDTTVRAVSGEGAGRHRRGRGSA